jgi:putative addiction module component (TIGR02574 family)
MSLTLQQLKNAAAELPVDQRAQLAEFLLDSLGEQDENVTRAEWLAVAEERLAELRAGKVVGIPAEQVLNNLLRPA